jgi:phospholipase/carboxylesterase
MERSSLFYKAVTLKDRDVPHPALIMLHGRGTDEEDLLSLSGRFGRRMHILSVRAPYSFPPGGYTWFDIDESGRIDTEQFIEARKRFFNFTDTACSSLNIDRDRIFLFGFSLGAVMSLMVSLNKPDRFKGVVAHSGMLPDDRLTSIRSAGNSKTSYFIAHGLYDPVVPVELGRQAYDQLLKLNFEISYKEYPIEHTISEESLDDIGQWLFARI